MLTSAQKVYLARQKCHSTLLISCFSHKIEVYSHTFEVAFVLYLEQAGKGYGFSPLIGVCPHPLIVNYYSFA